MSDRPTPETDAASCSNGVEMLTAQSDPFALYQKLCEATARIDQWENDFDLMKRELAEAREQCGGIENMKLKLEIASVKTKLASVVSIARQGRYSAMDFVAVGKLLDAMDDYLANPQHQRGETK